jgi:hypothetical protein
MSVDRTIIEFALNETISNEGGMRFQGLAVVLLKLRWPEWKLIACERKNDLGLDAHSHSELSEDGAPKKLACSITPKLSKIKSDIGVPGNLVPVRNIRNWHERSWYGTRQEVST